MTSLLDTTRALAPVDTRGEYAKRSVIELFPVSAALVSAVTANNTTTLANAAELSVDVEAGKTYSIRAMLPLSLAAAANNIKVDLAGGSASGTCVGIAQFYDFAAAVTRAIAVAALNTNIDGSTTTAWEACIIDATLVCSASGTIVLRYAQSVAAATASTILAGATIRAEKI